ncbi:MAG: Sporulation integral membrane protein YlbJ [Firmicutes bacterium]|nr:Sporulation integral membrane protein YlbJ [Bacillota bacterium]
MATVVGLVDLLATAVAVPLAVIGVSGALSDSVVSGLFEITIGTELCASAGAPLMQRVAMAGAIIAWSGLSVHGQVASVVHDTDIRIGPYLLARLARAVLAFVYTMLLWNVSGGLLGATLPVLFSAVPAATPSFVLQRMAFAGIRALGFLGITLVLSAIVVGLCKIRRGCCG